MFNRMEFFELGDIILTVVDVAIVAFVAYKLIMLIKDTRAVQLVKGLAVLVVAFLLSEMLQLQTIQWILDQTRLMILVALPIVFQPELRRALEQLGRGRFFARPLSFLGVKEASRLINELIKAVQHLSKNKIGALIVVERKTGIDDYVETGVRLDALVSAEFLLSLFAPGMPLHDGAAVIRGERVMAAGCVLPLTDSPYLSKQLGTRHRAALGISEVSDAVVIVVSEEMGTVSLAEGGKLTRYLDEKNLKKLLEDILLPKNSTPSFFFWQGRS